MIIKTLFRIFPLLSLNYVPYNMLSDTTTFNVATHSEINPTTVILTQSGSRSTNALDATSEYMIRAEKFGFASDKSIREALSQPGTIVLDVRTAEELSMNGRLTDLASFPSNRLTYKHSECTIVDCSTLRTMPEKVIPNLSTNTATIVVHCGSGLRASRAKELLMQHGYKGTILNAGSYSDIQKFFVN